MIQLILKAKTEDEAVDLILKLSYQELKEGEAVFEDEITRIKNIKIPHDKFEGDGLNNFHQKRNEILREARRYKMAIALILAHENSEQHHIDFIFENDAYINRLLEINPTWLKERLTNRDRWTYDANEYLHKYPYFKAGIIERSHITSCRFPYKFNSSCKTISLEMLKLDHDIIKIDLKEWLSKGVTESNFEPKYVEYLHPLAVKAGISKVELLRIYVNIIPLCKKEHPARSLTLLIRHLDASVEDYFEVYEDLCTAFCSPLIAPSKHFLTILEKIYAKKKGTPLRTLNELPSKLQTKSNPLIQAQLKTIKTILKNFPNIEFDYPATLIPLFLNVNPKIQLQTAKILNSLPDSYASEIEQILPSYKTSMTGETQESLAQWFNTTGTEETNSTTTLEVELIEEEIHPCQTLEDVLFAASSLLTKQSDTKSFDIFLDGIFRYQVIDREGLSAGFEKLAPKAMKMLDQLSPLYFSCQLNKTAAQIVAHFTSKAGEVYEMLGEFNDKIGGHFLNGFIEEVLNNPKQDLSLLSTPETDLGYISIESLISRFSKWENQKEEVLPYDFSLALARCRMNNSLPEHKFTSETEASRVMHFLLTGKVQGTISQVGLWQVASRTRNPNGGVTHDFLAEFDEVIDWAHPAPYDPFRYSDSWGSLKSYIPEKIAALEMIPLLSSGREYFEYATDITLLFMMAPSQYPMLLKITSEYLKEFLYDSSSKHVKAKSSSMIDFIHRAHPPMCHDKATLMMIGLFHVPLHDQILDLWIQAEQTGKLQEHIQAMGLMLSKTLTNIPHKVLEQGEISYEWKLERVQNIIALPKICALGAPYDRYVKEMLDITFNEPLTTVRKGLAKALELYHDLLIKYPPSEIIDIEQNWDKDKITPSLKKWTKKILKLTQK